MNFQSASVGKKQREAVTQALTAVFSEKPGKWHVQFIGHAGDMEMRVSGPGVETSDYVDAALDPQAITEAITRVLSG